MPIAEKCASRFSPPPSGAMKPKALESLNHLSAPVALQPVPYNIERARPARQRRRQECDDANRARRISTASGRARVPDTGIVTRARPRPSSGAPPGGAPLEKTVAIIKH